MARLILYVIVVALLVATGVWLADDPGMVMLSWRGWRVDTSVGVLVAALAVIVVVMMLGLRVVAAVTGTMRAMAAARRERRTARGLESLGHGFAAVHAGQKETASRLAKEAGHLLSDNPAVLFLRREAAALHGNTAEERAAATALAAQPETELAGLRMLATSALSEGDTAGALEYARRALGRRDAPDWAVIMVIDLDIANGRWNQALAALDSRLGRKAYTPQIHARLLTKVLVRVAEQALAHGDAIAAAAAKRALGNGTQRDAVVVYARAMAAQGKGKKAAGLVERAWAAEPHLDLLGAYRALVPGETALDWAKRVDNLAKTAPDHVESRLAVAVASLEAELWGQARNRLSGLTAEGVAPQVRARAARLLAELETRQRGDASAAADWLKVALEFHEATPQTKPAPRSAAELLAN